MHGVRIACCSMLLERCNVRVSWLLGCHALHPPACIPYLWHSSVNRLLPLPLAPRRSCQPLPTLTGCRPSQLCSASCPSGCPGGAYSVEAATSAASSQPSTYLLAWAGPANSTACNDALFVLDIDPHSPAFGSIVAVAEAPTGGNEPHHVGLSDDGQVSGQLGKEGG